VIIALRAFSTTNPGFPTRKAVGASLLLAAFSGFLALFPKIEITLLRHSNNGGAIGQMLETGLVGLMGKVGAAIVLAAASVLTLMLTMEISLTRISGWLKSIREARAEINQTKPSVFARLRAWWADRAEERRLLAAQRQAEKLAEQKRLEEERVERERERLLQEERERDERLKRMEEARRLKEEQPIPVSGPK